MKTETKKTKKKKKIRRRTPVTTTDVGFKPDTSGTRIRSIVAWVNILVCPFEGNASLATREW